MPSRVFTVLLFAALSCASATAICAGKSEELVDVPRSDKVVEYCLLQGKVIQIEEIGIGITRPKMLTLELRGERERAAFKTVDIQAIRDPDFQRAGHHLSFTDRWAYEQAAYLLDRYLGMHMVPVTVVRTIGEETGAVIHWVADAIGEVERRQRNLNPPDPDRLTKQRDLMRVFDALILNDDRNLTNMLVTLHDWKLHLIDHSRSFSFLKSLPKGFGEQPVRLPRSMYERLQSMERQGMEELFDGLITKGQLKALLVRRDKLLEEIEKDRQEYGDDRVFY